uniref:CCHC-type domain-containing protein n=1 Tax=Daphnia galeata TaxID=27404 RepID=A0A8J2RD20_9CRUS|nr:unnamed protein product [Daphnia galeata]
MLNNDVFGARPKSKCTPILSVENPLYDTVELHIQSVSPTTLNPVDDDLQICFDGIIDEEESGIVNTSEYIPRSAKLREARTKVCSEIEKKLRSYSGYQPVESLLKTPARKEWVRQTGPFASLPKERSLSPPVFTRITTTPSPQSSSSPRAISLKSPVIGWTRRISKFLKKASNGRTVRKFGTEPCSGASRCAETQTLPGHAGQLERNLSNTKSPTSVPHSSFEQLRGKKSRFSKRQSRSLGAVNSVNAGYLPVGKQTNRNRSVSGNKGGRVNNQISLFPSVSTNIRRHNQAGGESRTLTKIALSCARKVLTFLIGEILCLQQLLPLVPRGIGSFFLDITLNEDLLSTDKNGEYYLLEHEVGELSHFILESSVNFYTNLLTNIRTLNKILTLIHKLGQLQPCNPYPLKTIKPELDSLENNKGIEENILVNDPTSSQHNSRRSSVANEQGKCEEQPIRSLTRVDQPSQSSPSATRIEHHRKSTRSAKGIQQSSEPLHADFLTQTVEKEQTISKGQPESERRNSGGGFFGGRLGCTILYEGRQPGNSRSDNSSRNRYTELDKQRQVSQTFGIFPQPLADSENSKSPTIGKNNSSLAPVTDIKMNTPKFAAASDLSAFQRDQHKAVRKPGEKVYNFAIRLRELFQRTYPKNHEEDSFQMILRERFVDGLDEKLQMKVKYKKFETFDDLISATRKYSTRMEAIGGQGERDDFVNAIKQVAAPNESELKEIKQIMREQHQTVNAIANVLKQGAKQTEEVVTEQNELSNSVRELSKAVNFLLLKDEKQQYTKKPMNYQNQVKNFQPAQNIGNSPRLPFKPFINNNTQPNQPFYSKPVWQPQPTSWQQNSQALQQQPFQQQNQINFPPPQPGYQMQRRCYKCGVEGHIRSQCPVQQQSNWSQPQQMSILESANPPGPFTNTGKPISINCGFGSVDSEPLIQSRKVAKLTTWTNESTPRIPLSSFQRSFQALFDTGAARSVMHSKLFQSLPSRSRGACSNLDFDLYDVHDKKFNTFGQVTLPIMYGETLLLQDFVISDGISEECILGWDAIRKHGFTIDGENQSIYLANEGSSQIKENHSMHSVCLPRTSQLGTIEIASSLIGKEVSAEYNKSKVNSQWNGVAEVIFEKPEGKTNQEVSAEDYSQRNGVAEFLFTEPVLSQNIEHGK